MQSPECGRARVIHWVPLERTQGGYPWKACPALGLMQKWQGGEEGK